MRTYIKPIRRYTCSQFNSGRLLPLICHLLIGSRYIGLFAGTCVGDSVIWYTVNWAGSKRGVDYPMRPKWTYRQ